MKAENYFLVSSGLLTAQHRRRIGPAVWEFLWLIDHQFKPKNGDLDLGLVMNGDAITHGRIASELGVSSRTVLRNLEQLESEGYIRAEEIKGVGSRFFISNPKRWKFITYDKSVTPPMTEMSHPLRQKCHTPYDKNVTRNKDQDSQDSQDFKTMGASRLFTGELPVGVRKRNERERQQNIAEAKRRRLIQ